MVWVVAQTKSANEISVSSEMQADGISVYCPKALVTRTHARRVYEREEALFPRYFFVDVARQNDAYGIARVYKRVIANIVSFDGHPSIVRREILDGIRAAEVNGYTVIVKPQKWRPSEGDRVRVKSGSFADKIGVISTLNGKARAFVLLDSLCCNVAINELEAA